MSSTIFFFLFIPLLAFILLAVNLIFAPHNPYMEKNNVFECGFSSFLGQNRTQFSISFFIFALLFLLFDLEILLVYPYLVSAYTNGAYGLAIMLMFLLALTLGFAFELGKKALHIDSRQMSKVATCKSDYLNKVKGNISLDVMLRNTSDLAKTINNKQYFISSDDSSSLLGKRRLSALAIRPYSTGSSPSNSNPRKFNLNSIPPHHYNLFFTGAEAVNYDFLYHELEKAFNLESRQVIFRLAFRVIDMPALDYISDRVKRSLLLLDIVRNMTPNVPFHKEGIEFTFGPEVVQVLVEMIINVLVNKGKKPKDVYIQISYWPLEKDDGHNSNNGHPGAYGIYHPGAYGIYRQPSAYDNADRDGYCNDDHDD